jgi:UPF0755 protein
MKTKRLPILFVSIAIAGCMCLVMAAAGAGLLSLPARAAHIFGQPSEQLGELQRYTIAAQLLMQQEDLNQPLQPAAPEQSFRVEQGESTVSITDRLQSGGFIANAEAMRNFLVYAGLDTSIQAGDYQLSPGMTALEIAQALQDATSAEVTFNILPGWRLEEIAAAIPTSGLSFTSEAFLAAARQAPVGNPLSQELPASATLEGFLFPDSYQVSREATIEEFINQALGDFQVKLTDDLRQGFASQGLSLYQAVILASIVQREAIVETEMPTIASVYLNRLNTGMKLDADPTEQYALGYNQAQQKWWTSPLSAEDLQVTSPYNTYLYAGLPPGPIANPGLKALQAVALPAQTPYYYFRAACDGSGTHVFSETFEEHLEADCSQ